jgi:carboxymethylenebutenolidase
LRRLGCAVALALGLAGGPMDTAAQTLQRSTACHGSVDVPVEIARPEGRGPWPAVLHIHAKRGFEDVDREHVRALARDGFLVMAPDWLAAHMIER